MDRNSQVFMSEKRLYGLDEKFNHHQRSIYKPVEQQIFKNDEWDCKLLYPLLAAGTSAMHEKLCSYAHTLLPGGKYWDPDPAVDAVLMKLKPNNDLCESILGLNDYLTTAIPNLHQLSRSNLIQIKKNKTIQWFQQLSQRRRCAIVELAIKRRKVVSEEYKKEETLRSSKRREKMVREKCRRDALQQRVDKEKEQLSQCRLMTSPDELSKALSEIEDEPLSLRKRSEKMRIILKQQINIRKKILKQNIKIPFTSKGRQRSTKVIANELLDFIAANSEGTMQ